MRYVTVILKTFDSSLTNVERLSNHGGGGIGGGDGVVVVWWW